MNVDNISRCYYQRFVLSSIILLIVPVYRLWTEHISHLFDYFATKKKEKKKRKKGQTHKKKKGCVAVYSGVIGERLISVIHAFGFFFFKCSLVPISLF